MAEKTPSRIAGALLGLHAQTAMHPGAGTALGAVDLPVQRERHTHWPTVPGSALKGVLRDACRDQVSRSPGLETEELVHQDRSSLTGRRRADATLSIATLFGPPTADSSEFAGAVSVTDARLLAFPVRSLRGVFAWATCPQALERLFRDAAMAALPCPTERLEIPDNHAMVADGCPCLISEASDRLVLEEFEFKRLSKLINPALITWLVDNLLPNTPAYAPTRARFAKQLVVLSDNDFTHFARHATEVSARVGLNYETKTVKDGALFYQEFLPAETLLYAVVLVNPARSGRGTDAATLLGQLGGYLPGMLQIGGDETTGKGFCATRLGTGGRA